MTEVDVQATSSTGAGGGALPDRYPSIAISRQSHSSMEADNEAPESNVQSAYYAPPYARPQADRDHQQESLLQDRERGDLTAHNLELIPDADHVAPGIRLDRGGNDYPFQHRGTRGEHRQEGVQANSLAAGRDVNNISLDDGAAPPVDVGVDKRSSIGGKTPSSIGAATGRSSNGGLRMGIGDVDGDAAIDDSGGLYEDVEEGIDDDVVYDEKNVAIVHERMGGSGATSENASKGTSVGHFGPRGEAIPGVPPHLDPRQPHFRPPSPGAASVLSVAVHPPASPKLHGASGLSSTGMTTSISSEISDSGEETESFDNGAMTPTLSEMEDDDHIDKIRGVDPSSPNAGSGGSSIDSTNHFNFARMSLGSGGPQVSFDPNVLSHESDDFIGLSRSARAPSIAATAGSSRAPSARGLSPPVSLSRATTTEGSSLEEYESTGAGIGDSGAETPSIMRSRRSSYSAPSSEVEGAMGGSARMEAVDSSTRARGATLVASSANQMGNSTTNLHDEAEDESRNGPSLAPSEVGSDSTRSMTHESSSVDHGLYTTNSSSGQRLGGLGSNELLARHLLSSSSPNQLATSIATLDFVPQGDAATASQSKAPIQPILPSLLAIKKASRRNGSGAASTAATAGTTSPASSLSVEGDFEDASGAFTEQ